MTKDEALRLALEALEFDSFYGTGKQEAITAIKEALMSGTDGAQPEQKPVAWMVWGENNVPSLTFTKPSDKYVFDSLYMTPPQRKPLTDEEIQDALESEFLGSDAKRNWQDDLRVARAIEAKLKEKNT